MRMISLLRGGAGLVATSTFLWNHERFDLVFELLYLERNHGRNVLAPMNCDHTPHCLLHSTVIQCQLYVFAGKVKPAVCCVDRPTSQAKLPHV